MAHYVFLGQFTGQGSANIKDTGKRAKALRELAKGMGVTLKDIYWTMGKIDLVITLEAANDEAAAVLSMKVSSLGNIKLQTLRAFGESEIDSLTSKI